MGLKTTSRKNKTTGTGSNRGPLEAPSSNLAAISPEELHRRIAEAAYFKAEQRGFGNHGQEQDWYEAEAEIVAQIMAGREGN